MAEIIRIKKGLDIPLSGKPSSEVTADNKTTLFAICPDDFPGHIWKSVVKPGDSVVAGQPLLKDKATGRIVLASPVSGKVEEVRRGERRHIEFINVSKDSDKAPEKRALPRDREQIRNIILESGLWAMIRQRPYDIIPDPDNVPRDIFVTAFDSAPLAGDILDESVLRWMEIGFKNLIMLTSGGIYLGVKAGTDIKSKYSKVYEFDGPHPAGNVGTQIAAIKPVNKGETVWTLDAATVAKIGRLCEEGVYDFSTRVAITGPEVKNPRIVSTHMGASIDTLLDGELKTENDIRIISGNVLTGIKVKKDGFLRFPYRQITVIDEGANADEFMGWASLSPKKYSVKRSFPAFLRGLSKPFDFDARIKGGHRAMILSGEYDKVFPFDIYPEYLLKAIMAGDIDRMEKLGIYEVAPEDFALPEFVDTSKIELQKIVREGLDNLRKELS